MRVIIPVSGIQNNSEFFPEPEKFDPLRFSKENATTIQNYTYLPFGEGGRYCIGKQFSIILLHCANARDNYFLLNYYLFTSCTGKRFAVVQAKLSILSMLSNYTFAISEQTQNPPQYVSDNLARTAEDGVKLKVTRRLRA